MIFSCYSISGRLRANRTVDKMILTLFGSLLVDGDNLLFTSPLSLFAIIEHLALQSITFKIWLFHIETFRDNFHRKKDMEIWLALLTEWTDAPSGPHQLTTPLRTNLLLT